MLATEPATTPPHLHHPKSAGRKPLQPKNTFFITSTPKPKAFPQPIINVSSNKENIDLQCFDASLAEELSAVKQKLERLKLDRDNTHKLLQEKDRILDIQFTELLHRGELQKELEIEVDRLYRLKQLHSASMQRSSPIRSLREKETEKKKTQIDAATVAGEKSREIKELEMEIKDEESSTSTSTSSKSTGTWKIVLPIPLKFSLLETHNITQTSG